MGQVIDIAEARRKRDEKLAEVGELTTESLETAIAKLRQWAAEIESGVISIEEGEDNV
jgi:hypothetical protein